MSKWFGFADSRDGGHKILSIFGFKVKFRSKKLLTEVYLFDDRSEVRITRQSDLPKNLSIINSSTRGGYNVVKIHKNLKCRHVRLSFSERCVNSLCVLEDSGDSAGLDMEAIFLPGEGSELRIGKRTGMNGTKIWLGNGSKCFIGDDCRFSYEIIIRTTDGHTIVEEGTSHVLNQQKNPCVIGNSCWIGLRSIINKNVVLPHDTIVGSGSVVTSKFDEPYIIVAGNPAKVIRHHVKHHRETIYDYQKSAD